MSLILIHVSVTDILKYLDRSIVLKVYEVAEQHLYKVKPSLPLRSIEFIEAQAVELRIELFKYQCLAVFLTITGDQLFVFHAYPCHLDDLSIADEVIDESQNLLQEMYDGLNTLHFNL